MPIATQQVIRQTVPHPGYRDSHEPLHKPEDVCTGCEDFKSRRMRNHRAGKTVGVAIRGEHPDEPAGACKGCTAPAYPGHSGDAPCWAWNFNVDRAEWAVEPRTSQSPPRSLCPRCRKKPEAAE